MNNQDNLRCTAHFFIKHCTKKTYLTRLKKVTEIIAITMALGLSISCTEKSADVKAHAETQETTSVNASETSLSMEQAQMPKLILVTFNLSMKKSCGAMPTLDKALCTGEKPAALTVKLINQHNHQEFIITSNVSGVATNNLLAGEYYIETQGPLSVTPKQLTISEQQNVVKLSFQPQLR